MVVDKAGKIFDDRRKAERRKGTIQVLDERRKNDRRVQTKNIK